MRTRVLVIRLILGAVFGVLLSRMFFPTYGKWPIFALGGMLVFFAYCFEYLHKRDRG